MHLPKFLQFPDTGSWQFGTYSTLSFGLITFSFTSLYRTLYNKSLDLINLIFIWGFIFHLNPRKKRPWLLLCEFLPYNICFEWLDNLLAMW
jgi:uncharacterized BrkB/YihY/UPF0761 family membrane protein